MKLVIKAISEAKKEIGKISKDSENPFFKSMYFDINQLLQHVEPVLEKHGLVVLQPIQDNIVYSNIYHIESGEIISSFIELPSLNDPQKLGSAITYYRRYTLQSLLSLQAEDDDGNNGTPEKKTKKDDEPEKPWLNRTSKDGTLLVVYTKVVKGAREKGLKTSDLLNHYKISKEVQEMLKKDLAE